MVCTYYIRQRKTSVRHTSFEHDVDAIVATSSSNFLLEVFVPWLLITTERAAAWRNEFGERGAEKSIRDAIDSCRIF